MHTLLTAHSGADNTPDNSLEFVRHVLTTSADALEVDVRRASDGRLVLGHDAATPVPLDEVMKLTADHPSMVVNCDLKEPGLEEDAAALAEQFGLGGRLVFSGETDPEKYGNSPFLRKTAELYFNAENFVADIYARYRENPDFDLETAERMLELCGRCGIRVVNIDFHLVTERLVSRLAGGGIGVSAWTADADEDILRLLRLGVFNITTCRLTRALDLREQFWPFCTLGG